MRCCAAFGYRPPAWYLTFKQETEPRLGDRGWFASGAAAAGYGRRASPHDHRADRAVRPGGAGRVAAGHGARRAVRRTRSAAARPGRARRAPSARSAAASRWSSPCWCSRRAEPAARDRTRRLPAGQPRIALPGAAVRVHRRPAAASRAARSAARSSQPVMPEGGAEVAGPPPGLDGDRAVQQVQVGLDRGGVGRQAERRAGPVRGQPGDAGVARHAERGRRARQLAGAGQRRSASPRSSASRALSSCCLNASRQPNTRSPVQQPRGLASRAAAPSGSPCVQAQLGEVLQGGDRELRGALPRRRARAPRGAGRAPRCVAPRLRSTQPAKFTARPANRGTWRRSTSAVYWANAARARPRARPARARGR